MNEIKRFAVVVDYWEDIEPVDPESYMIDDGGFHGNDGLEILRYEPER
jgi:hypothetical protein